MNFISAIKNDIRKIDQSKQVMRKFGLLLGIILAVFCAIVFYKHRSEVEIPISVFVFGILSIFSFITALLYPKALKPINTVMIFIGMIIGWIMTRVILTILFFVVILPIGLVLRISGHDSMNRKPDAKLQSYWLEKKETDLLPERYERLF